MRCVLNDKRFVILAVIIVLIPTDVFWIVYNSLVQNFNYNNAFNSIPLVLLLKNYDFTNIYIFNQYQKYFKPPDSDLNLSHIPYNKTTHVLSIRGIRDMYLLYRKSYSKEIGELDIEAERAYKKAIEFKSNNRPHKAKRLLAHALKLDSNNADILAEFGEIIEIHESDVIMANYLCSKAILTQPTHRKAQECKKRTSPIVKELDQKKLNEIDSKVLLFYKIPENSPNLKQFKKEQYFSYIYHTTAIEGNTLSLAQTRFIIETRLAVGGKSLMEQNEVLGVDFALKYLNSLLSEGKERISIDDILEFHKRILGFVDISEAGHFRRNQVFIADHTPPPSEDIPRIMAEFIDWLNSDDIKELHPIESAALAHWQLVFIHPFADGNGRTARLLMNLILMKANYPPCIVRTEDKEKYFKLIKMADEDDVRPFIRFIAECTERTLDDLLKTYSDTENLISSTTINAQNLSFFLARSE